MRSSRVHRAAPLAAAFLVALLLGAAGCGFFFTAGPVEEGVIEPAAPAEASADLDLGPGVRPLSFGPGDKSSPRIGPSGDRVAFVLDGYVVEKSLYARDIQRRTAKGFSATNADWLSEEDLAVVGLGPSGEGVRAGGEETGSLFVVRPNDPRPDGLAEGVRATGTQAGGGGSIVAAVASPGREEESTLARVRADGNAAKRLPAVFRGRISGLSLFGDGREAVLAARLGSGKDAGRAEIVTYRLAEGLPRRVALLNEGLEVIGAPQMTSRGIYFVAGEEGNEEADNALYRVPEGSEGYERVREVGGEFVPASIAVSPDGASLAVLGRRSSRSPTDLYVLDLASNALDAVTANENMEIKTNPRDLAWSPDGAYVTVVARGVLPGPKVYGTPATDLSSAFYNVYGVPTGTAARGTGGGSG